MKRSTMVFGYERIIFKDHKISIIIAWILRIFLLSFAIYEIIFGFPVYGIMTLIAVFVMLLPDVLTGGHIFIPLHLQILLMIIILFEYTVADAMGFYARFSYYDKFQHTMIPTILSFIGMLIIYIGHRLGKFEGSYILAGIMIIFITIGMGAVLEVIEYSYDHFIGPATNFYISQGALTQGSPVMDPFTDTMFDLMYDILGATIGGILGVWLLRRHQKDNKKSLLDEEIDFMEKYRNIRNDS